MTSRRDADMIPNERLPPGFAERIEHLPASPAIPLPAATAVLLRDSAEGIEVLLLKRHKASGFVPGAYVFPGGRVDPADSSAELHALASALPGTVPHEPPLEYWMATIREVFEETGVLLARDAGGNPLSSEPPDFRLPEMREGLMTDSIGLADVLQALDARPHLDALAYAAHWITPVVEPRRYDTRFFYAVLPPGAHATADAREMSDARWLSPAKALEEFRSGALPMVFPTVRTIEDLVVFETTAAAMRAARSMTVKPILPSLVRVPGGVGLVIDDDKDVTSG